MSMKKSIIACLLFSFAFAIAAVELTATVQEITGKVEIRRPGGTWTLASVGTVLRQGDSISTGFNSKAVMKLGDSAVLIASALTRLTIEELLDKEGTVSTDLFLNVGNIRGEVKSASQTPQDFQVRSANSTASVRGTVIDVEILGDGASMKVLAWDGLAAVLDVRTLRITQIGQQKPAPLIDDTEDAEDEEPDDVDDDAPDAIPDPPAAIAAAPVLAGTPAGGLLSSLDTRGAGSSLSVNSRPPSPGTFTFGGISISDDGTSTISDADIQVIQSLFSNVVIKVEWNHE